MASSSQQREVEMRNFSTEPIVKKEAALQPTYTPSVTSVPKNKNDKHKVKEQKIKLPPNEDIHKVIIKSTLADADSMKQAEKIKQKFNEDIQQSAFVEPGPLTASGMRGVFLERDEFMLASRNRVAELATFNKDYNTATVIKGDGTEIKEHGRFKHYDLFFGHNGSYVLNVPQDKFAKAMSGQKPLLFGPGPHVIKDANFNFDPKKGFINQSESVISHGNLHIILVPRGSIAKIWIGTEPYILEHSEEPYVFNSPQFKIDKNDNNGFFFAQEQANQALISAAQAKLDAAKLEAEAMRIRAAAEAEAIVTKAKAEQEAAALKGEMYQKYPQLLQKDMVDRLMQTEEKRPIYPPSAGSVFPADYFSQFRAPGMFSAAQPGLPSSPEASKVVRLPVAPDGKV